MSVTEFVRSVVRSVFGAFGGRPAAAGSGRPAPRRAPRPARFGGLLGGALLLLLLTGCRPGPSPTAAAPTAPVDAAARPTVVLVAQRGDAPLRFDPAAFDWPPAGVNPWLPLTPGYQSVRLGTLNRGSRQLEHRRVYTVTNATKEIAGVRAVLVLDQDFDAGEIAEQAIDYLAQDRHGNVWYLGSYTEGYQGGRFVSAHDAWLAGVRGAEAGVLMLADPQQGARYIQARVPGEGAADAEVAEVGVSRCVPFDCFDNVLAVLEDGSEFKYYAHGVGAILTEPNYRGGEQETETLVNLTELSAEGLAELSAEALRLDEHARSTAPRVFGDSAPATASP